MQNINPATRYKISPFANNNTFIAYDQQDELTLTDSNSRNGVSNPLEFAISPSTNYPSYWNICADLSNGKFCMDQWGNNASQPAFQSQANVLGQQWNFTRNLRGQTTVWQMQSLWAGSRLLTAYDGGSLLAMLDGASSENTLFQFIDVSPSMSTTATSAATSATTSSTTSSTVSTTITSQTSAASQTSRAYPASPSSSSKLSSGAVAGIVVGAILVIALIGAIFFFYRRKTQRSTRPPAYSEKVPVSYKTGIPERGVHEMIGSHSPPLELSHEQAARYELAT